MSPQLASRPAKSTSGRSTRPNAGPLSPRTSSKSRKTWSTFSEKTSSTSTLLTSCKSAASIKKTKKSTSSPSTRCSSREKAAAQTVSSGCRCSSVSTIATARKRWSPLALGSSEGRAPRERKAFNISKTTILTPTRYKARPTAMLDRNGAAETERLSCRRSSRLTLSISFHQIQTIGTILAILATLAIHGYRSTSNTRPDSPMLPRRMLRRSSKLSRHCRSASRLVLKPPR